MRFGFGNDIPALALNQAGASACDRNLLAYSSDFTNAWWTKTTVGLLPGTTPAPPGFSGNALQYDNTAPSSSHLMRDHPSGLVYADDNVLSGYVQAGQQLNGSGETFPQLSLWGYESGAWDFANWTLKASTCVIKGYSASIDGYGSEDVGAGWFRVWMYVDGSTFGGGEVRALLYPNEQEGAGEYSTYLFGSQFEHDVTSPTALCEMPQ